MGVTVAVLGCGLILIYSLYCYQEVNTKLRRSEEKADRIKQQHDSLSAQLQVVYEHKSRIEKSLQQEKFDHRKTKTEMLSQKAESETRFYNEKQELLNRVSSINQEHKMLQSQHEDLQTELTKLQEKHVKLQEDHDVVQTQHNSEYQQLKQEKENEVASLKDEVANLNRKNNDLQRRLDLVMQSNQYNMQNRNVQPQQNQQPQLQQQLQQQQQQQAVKNQAFVQQQNEEPKIGIQQNDSHLGDQALQYQNKPNLPDEQQQYANQQNQQHSANINQANLLAGQQQQQRSIPSNVQEHPIPDKKVLDKPQNINQPNQHAPQQQNNAMQVNAPNLKPNEDRDSQNVVRLEKQRKRLIEKLDRRAMSRNKADDVLKQKINQNMMQIGKPKFEDGGLGQPSFQRGTPIQAPGGGDGNFGAAAKPIRGPVIRKNKSDKDEVLQHQVQRPIVDEAQQYEHDKENQIARRQNRMNMGRM